MTKAKATAYRLRWLILIAGIIYTLLGLAWLILPFFNDTSFVNALFGGSEGAGAAGLMYTPLTPGRLLVTEEWGYGVNVALVLGLLLLAQWAFLRPGGGWTVRVTAVGRPLKSAVIAAALMAMLLTIGAIALLLELPNWWAPIMGGIDDDAIAGGWGITGVWAAMLIAWGVWAWIFFIYWRQGDRYTQMGKMIRGLVAGSLLEIFVAVPVHVWAVRQRECYCCRGTYVTLVFAGAVLLFAFGPGIVLLYAREKHRRAKLLWGQTFECPKCRYDLRGSIPAGSTTCPECGAAIPGYPPQPLNNTSE